MRRTYKQALSVLPAFVVMLLWLPGGGCSPSGPASRLCLKENVKMVDGVWIPVNAELGGQEFSSAVLRTMKLAIKDGMYTVNVGEKLDKGTVRVDPASRLSLSSASPNAMDITGTEGPNKGKTFLAIYELRGDTLRICYDLDGKSRPTEFKTVTGTQEFLVNYDRSKN